MLDSHSAGAMNALRDKAFEDFTRQGFPTQKVERYKYTDVPGGLCAGLRAEPEPGRVSRQSLRGLPVRRAEPEHFALFCGERRFLPEVAAGRRVARRRGGMLPEAGGRGLSRPGVGLLRQTGRTEKTRLMR